MGHNNGDTILTMPGNILLLCMAAAVWQSAPQALVSTAFAQQAALETEIIAKFARNNREETVWDTWEMGDDCKVIRGFNVTVSQLPQQGTAELRFVNRMVTDEFLNDFRLNARHVALVRKCQGVQLPVITLFYNAKPGYVGFDKVKVLITSTDGRRREADIRLRIQ